MKVDLHRKIPKELFERLKKAEDRFKFPEILEAGLNLVENSNNFKEKLPKYNESLARNVAELKISVNKLKILLDKYRYLIGEVRDSISFLKSFVKELVDLKNSFNENLAKELNRIVKRYNDLLDNYRSDVAGLLSILKNYLDENEIKLYVRKFNKKFREFNLE